MSNTGLLPACGTVTRWPLASICTWKELAWLWKTRSWWVAEYLGQCLCLLKHFWFILLKPCLGPWQAHIYPQNKTTIFEAPWNFHLLNKTQKASCSPSTIIASCQSWLAGAKIKVFLQGVLQHPATKHFQNLNPSVEPGSWNVKTVNTVWTLEKPPKKERNHDYETSVNTDWLEGPNLHPFGSWLYFCQKTMINVISKRNIYTTNILCLDSINSLLIHLERWENRNLSAQQAGETSSASSSSGSLCRRPVKSWHSRRQSNKIFVGLLFLPFWTGNTSTATPAASSSAFVVNLVWYSSHPFHKQAS